MKTLGMLLAGAALCGSAHATVYQYEFSATIENMLMFSPGTGSGGIVDSSSLAGDTIAVGDLVRGRFSYDTETGAMGDFGAGPVYAAGAAANTLSAASAGHNFALSAPTSGSTMVQVANNAALLGGGDNLTIGNATENEAAQQLLVVNFFDQSGLALSDSGIPGAIDGGAFSQSTFYFLYTAKDSRAMLGANGALTSLTLIAAVPEARTYAMLLSGLGVLGFLTRRRKQYSR